MARFQP
ncbi:hypothetical protein CP02DC22_1121A, partial [Chlamydia psittaci 02DC22]